MPVVTPFWSLIGLPTNHKTNLSNGTVIKNNNNENKHKDEKALCLNHPCASALCAKGEGVGAIVRSFHYSSRPPQPLQQPYVSIADL